VEFFLLGSKKCFCSLCIGKIDGKGREAARNALSRIASSSQPLIACLLIYVLGI
jgi:hypothetical protein